jgi:lysophospholipase L1-like esterase
MAGGPFSRRRAARRSLAALAAGLCVTLGAPADATAEVWVPAGLACSGSHGEDGYHPNDEGHRLMAEAIDADAFAPSSCSPSRP